MDSTISIRKRLGFPTKNQFLKKHALFTRNSLLIAQHEIMQRWETNYMKQLACIACSRGGSILEVGFGMGISSHFIQQYFNSRHRIRNHVVIEAHPDVCKYARTMYKKEMKAKTLHLIKGFWQDVTSAMKNEFYNGILFDTYPLSENEIHRNHFSFFSEAFRLLKKGGVLTYYSDESKKFSKTHIRKLKEAGFSQIKWKLCKVNPPKGSMYWRRKTILSPIIVK